MNIDPGMNKPVDDNLYMPKDGWEKTTRPTTNKWYQDGKGNTSAMRILSMAAGIVGLAISISGAVAMFLNSGSAATAMSIGLALTGLALGAKVGQKYAEKG